MRKVAGHSGTVGLDAVKEAAYLESLKARSIESLKDAVADESVAFFKAIDSLKKDATDLAGKETVANTVDATDVDKNKKAEADKKAKAKITDIL